MDSDAFTPRAHASLDQSAEPLPARRSRRQRSGDAAALSSPPLQPLPRWVVAPLPVPAAGGRTADIAFAAGAALCGLDLALRGAPAWSGVLRMRLALRAALSATRLVRLSADEASLRDAAYLTRPGDDPGPAGRLHRLLRRLASRPVSMAGESLTDLAAELGRGTTAAEVLALAEADRTLAERLGWPVVLPLHLAGVFDPAVRRGSDGRRPSVSEAGASGTLDAILARACLVAHADAVVLSRRAEALVASATGLRTREGAAGLALILADDAVAPWRMVRAGTRGGGRATASTPGLGSDRAARRFCESLHARGSLRLLTERPTFRLYGL